LPRRRSRRRRPVRLELLRRLAALGEVTCAPPGLDIPKSTLSNHWRILREVDLRATVIDGRGYRMRLRTADLEETAFPASSAPCCARSATARCPAEPRMCWQAKATAARRSRGRCRS
jgi:hypothetical protein